MGSEMIASLKISTVVQGSVSEDGNVNSLSFNGSSIDPYVVPKELGIFITIDSPHDITVLDIVQRIQTQRSRFNAKFAQKKLAEDEYYSRRYANSTPISASAVVAMND